MTTSAKSKSKITEWRNGSAGFFKWLEDVQPQVPASKGGYETYVPGPRERMEIQKALDGNYGTIVFCWPRRHGKTLASALIIIWRFLTRRTQTVAMVANSEKQTVDTAFKLVSTIFKQTPYMAEMIKAGTVVLTADKLEYAALSNVIQGFSSNPAALYGKKLSIAQVSELHAATSDASYQVLSSSTVDTDDGLVLVDSTVGPRSSPLYTLYQLAQNGDDPTLFFSHISYRDLNDACDNSPRWIKPERIRSRAAQMLPAEFTQQHLNQWTNGVSALFPPEVLDKCRDVYRFDVPSVTGGAAYVVGGGVDRAFGFSVHGDATITTAALKTLIGEEAHYFVLASDKIAFSSESGIKNALSRYAKDFNMSKVALEQYNVQDIAGWCGNQSFDHEIIHPTLERQGNAFTALYNAANEGRLHIHPSLERLLSEMETFEYRLVAGGHGGSNAPRFEAAKGAHDDTVYSLAWAVYSLREDELNPYELKSINCTGSGPAVWLCMLNGGELIPPCADRCRSMYQAKSLYQQYKGRGHLTPIAFPEFLSGKVKNIGAHTIPR